MAPDGDRPPIPRPDPEGGGRGGRLLRRRRNLPGGRAVTGGLLVAVSTIGVFAAHTDATARPRHRYVVAAHSVPVGNRLVAADLTTATVDLPPELQRNVFADPRRLVGATVLGPLGRGELVQASNVVAGDVAGAAQLSFSIEAARALNGTLVPGERVDLLATYGGAGGDAYTVAVARRVLIADTAGGGSSLGGSRAVVLTLSIDEPTSVLAIAHAVRGGNLTIVRSGTATGAGGGGDAYRPAPPAAETAPASAREQGG